MVTSFATGSRPISLSLVGKELYILNNGDNNITVINTDKNTRILGPALEENISVGINPQAIVKIGTKLYIINKGSDSVSVVDTVLKKVLKTISVGKSPVSGLVQ